ncbi:MAG: DUF5602 domain-containing protein [Actinomycetota bacterium]|nr:DUF5602 domain-containing protein [Actinomycetota bacterium]
MLSRAMRRYAGPILAACVALTSLAACGNGQSNKSGTFYGPPQSIGSGTAKAYVTLDNAGNPTEVGIRMSAASLDGLPQEDAVPPHMLILDFPRQASATPFNHVMLNWNSHGHEPVELFGRPHFDMHFYMIDPAAVAQIDPTKPDFATRAAHLPDQKYVPQDYVTPPGSPTENTVPAMGLHWLDSKAGFVPGKYDFKQTVINGSWDGTYTFIEPMMTREWMLTKQAVQEKIAQPQAYQKNAYFPTTYSVHYDDQEKEYAISLGGMTMRNAS